ncbi:peptidoglycan-binding protein [Candidatus Parcubacteria bacterium]|nr:peptidoglycan-binding protein [Candidatus Parcubacteria bacterium]
MFYKKIIISSVFLAVSGLLFFTGSPAVKAFYPQTLSDCMAIPAYNDRFSCLMTLLAQLQMQLAQLQGQQGQSQGWCYAFNTDFGIGSQGPDFGALVNVLYKENLYNPNTYVTPRYDETVAAAVVRLQARYGILQTGYVGPLTRAKLNSLYGCGIVQPYPYPYPYPQPQPYPYPVPYGSFVVNAPGAGEVWAQGSSHFIAWNSNGISNLAIDAIGFNGQQYHIALLQNLPSGNGTYNWIVGNVLSGGLMPAGQYRLKFYDPNNPSSPSFSDYFNVVLTSASPM